MNRKEHFAGFKQRAKIVLVVVVRGRRWHEVGAQWSVSVGRLTAPRTARSPNLLVHSRVNSFVGLLMDEIINYQTVE